MLLHATLLSPCFFHVTFSCEYFNNTGESVRCRFPTHNNFVEGTSKSRPSAMPTWQAVGGRPECHEEDPGLKKKQPFCCTLLFYGVQRCVRGIEKKVRRLSTSRLLLLVLCNMWSNSVEAFHRCHRCCSIQTLAPHHKCDGMSNEQCSKAAPVAFHKIILLVGSRGLKNKGF